MSTETHLLRLFFVTIITIFLIQIGAQFAKDADAVLKCAMGLGYAGLAIEAARKGHITETYICNGLTATYLAASYSGGFPLLGPDISEALDWALFWVPDKTVPESCYFNRPIMV